MRFLLFFFILFLSMNHSHAGAVFYCSEDKKIGFDPADAYEVFDYNEARFKAYIDFKREEFASDEIWFKNNAKIKCMYDEYSQSLYCLSDYGSAISIHEGSLKFHLSNIYNSGLEQKDDIYISHGFCEKF